MVALTDKQVQGLKKLAIARRVKLGTRLCDELNAIAKAYGFPGWPQLVSFNKTNKAV